MKIIWAAILVFVILENLTVLNALSCFCDQSCSRPTCCPSGKYTKDECGCCDVCAKAEGEKCGGPFGIAGTCSQGLGCLRSCDCETVTVNGVNHPCVFPFKFKGRTYNACTKTDSENGKAWCSYQVNRNDEAVPGKWADCKDGCPGTDYPCTQQDLINYDGKCINTQRSFSPPRFAYKIDDNTATFTNAPFCGGGGPRVDDRCRCDSGGCQLPAPGSRRVDRYCYLENLADPRNPQRDCFGDVQWEKGEGQFWSYAACAGIQF